MRKPKTFRSSTRKTVLPDIPAPAGLEQATAAANLYTVPASLDFVASVAAGLIERAKQDPLALADNVILVPDRAMAMALRAAFVAQLGEGVAMLPQIEAADSLDAETVALQVAKDSRRARALLNLPPVVTTAERQMVLAREIMKMDGVSPSLPAAMKLAAELGGLIDAAARHDVDLKKLDTMAAGKYQAQWQKTRDVLRIVTDIWPAYLGQQGRIDGCTRRRAVLSALSVHWRHNPPRQKITAVGFRDRDPGTLDLLAAIASAPQGEIVLQGFDPAIDDASWQQLGESHGDYATRVLFERIHASKADVALWPGRVERTGFARAVNPEQTNQARQKLLREAMRPAATAEGWGNLSLDAQALNGMDMITAGSPQEEASVIALKLRETLEVPGRTAAFVTADRALARRVSARLRHWNIDVPDSAGATLSASPLGIYLYATAHMAAEEWAPIPFLQALKHPLAALGRDPAAFKAELAVLEDKALHGPRPAPGARGVRASLRATFNEAATRRVGAMPAEEAKLQERALKKLVRDIVKAGDAYFKLMARRRPQPFHELLDAHIRFCEALADTPEQAGAQRLWRGADGVRAARFLSDLRQHAHLLPPMTGRDYAAIIDQMMRAVKVPQSAPAHPRLKILTPEQALLARADIVIVGGLTAQSFPPPPNENPWLTANMMAELGLPRPAATKGDAAHAFTQLLSAPNVLLTRAVRSGDAPTVASPLLTRLMMVVKAAGLEKNLVGKSQLLDIHTALQTPAEVNPIDPPAPTPAAKLRPRQLPVTAVETLMRDPYSVYARYVLKLRAKPPIDAAPGVADRGIATHAALDAFIRRYPEALPEQPYEELLKIGRETFAAHLDNPTVQSFWWPRFERVAAWFVRFEQERREMSRNLGTEVQGKLEIDLGDSIFTLTAIADRIDMNHSDQVEIIDYKTGSVPTQKSVALGFSPQMTLEALIAFTGGFEGIDAGNVGTLQYWKLSGGRPAADVTQIKADVRQLVTEARDGITGLMRHFADASTPYVSIPRPDWAPRYNNYAHLSRIGEWATVKKTEALQKPAVNRPSNKGPGKGKKAANQNRRPGRASGAGRKR